MRRADGSYVWLEVTLRLVPATSSNTLYNGPAEIVSVARDISKRKTVEAQLAAAKAQAEREAEERFRDLFDEAPIAYVHEGLDTRFLRANRAAMRSLGITPEEQHTIWLEPGSA